MGGEVSIGSTDLPDFVPLPHEDPDWNMVNGIDETNIHSFEFFLPILRKLSGRSDVDFEGLNYSIKIFGEKKFFDDILPFMVKLLKSTPIVLHKLKLPFLRQDNRGIIKISRKIASVLLVNAFFSTFFFFRKAADTNKRSRMNKFALNEINFDGLFCCPGKYKPTSGKICMLLHYFDRIRRKNPVGDLIIERKNLFGMSRILNTSDVYKGNSFDVFSKDLSECKSCLGEVFVYPKGSLKSMRSNNCRLGDFANKFVGGGVLDTGCVQEEIMFCESPELLLSMLFCPCMKVEEAIIIRGCEQFSQVKGYGKTLEFGGDFMDEYVGKYEVVAFDACDFRGGLGDRKIQYGKDFICKDLVKSFVAFHGGKLDISTGNWGCGAFRGDHRLKFIIQWISASVHGKKLHYFTFEGENPILSIEIEHFVKAMKTNNRTVEDIFKALNRLDSVIGNNSDLFDSSMLELVEKMVSGNL